MFLFDIEDFNCSFKSYSNRFSLTCKRVCGCGCGCVLVWVDLGVDVDPITSHHIHTHNLTHTHPLMLSFNNRLLSKTRRSELTSLAVQYLGPSDPNSASLELQTLVDRVHRHRLFNGFYRTSPVIQFVGSIYILTAVLILHFVSTISNVLHSFIHR
jgi:hypothetical protein